MTNKRQLKKYIKQVADEVATLIIPAAIYTKAMTEEQADEALCKLIELYRNALAKVSIAYDKTPDAFASMSQYNADKAKYFSIAYNALLKEYEDGINELLNQVNKDKK